MREIKFRVWSGNMWLDGGDALLHAKDRDSTNIELLAGHLLKEYTICQYTELKDRNGKGIYEGDIVKNVPNKSYLVEYIDGGYWLKQLPLRNARVLTRLCSEEIEGYESEVIGNIYENPELLKK